MKKIIPFILVLLSIIASHPLLFRNNKEPKGLMAKLKILWERKDDFAEFSKIYKLPIIWPNGLFIVGGYLYASDFCEGIQVIKLNLRGEPYTTSYFGKKYKDLKVSYTTKQGLAVKGNYLYVADSGNQRIQIIGINADGSLSPKFTFGKQGKELGEFDSPGGLAVKGNYLYVADSGNSRIQVLEIKY